MIYLFLSTAILSYSASAPGSFSYASYTGYPYNYPATAAAYHAPAVYPAATYPATAYVAAAYPSYHEDDGQYWPGKYEKSYIPAYKAGHHYWTLSQPWFSIFRGKNTVVF